MDLSSGPRIIIKVLDKRGQKHQQQERRCDGRAEVRLMRSHKPRNAVPLAAGKGKTRDSSLECPERTQPC